MDDIGTVDPLRSWEQDWVEFKLKPGWLIDGLLNTYV